MAAIDSADPGGSETNAAFPQGDEHERLTMLSRFGEAAVRLAELGYPVFRVRPGQKSPLARGWQAEASADPAAVARLWRRSPRANLGLATGRVCWVVDVDGADGRTALARLEACYGPLPPTPTSLTGGGGEHRFFALPPGRTVRNSCRRLGPGLDTRGVGGFAVLPPSMHPSGRAYAWQPGREPWSVPLASAPMWLLDSMVPPCPSAPPPSLPLHPSICSAYTNAALRRAVERVAGAVPGTRNSTLNAEAWSLARLAACGALPVETVATALASAALAAGLNAREVERTLASGLGAGFADPRGVRP